MGREDPHFRLRLPEELRDRLREEADVNGRSINAEIVTRLETSLLSGNAAGDVADQIMVNITSRLLSGANNKTGSAIHRIAVYYEDYKISRTQDLRKFLDVVNDALREVGGSERIALDEELDREFENTLARMRSWATAWGYDFVKVANDEERRGHNQEDAKGD